MLGLGAPGVWFALRPPREHWLPRLLLGGGLSLPLAVAAVLWIGNRLGPWSVVACMAFMLVPFLQLGAAVCLLLLTAKGGAVGRMYGADLLGAAIAAAVAVPVLHAVATPHGQDERDVRRCKRRLELERPLLRELGDEPRQALEPLRTARLAPPPPEARRNDDRGPAYSPTAARNACSASWPKGAASSPRIRRTPTPL